ncbi:MAG: glucan 1,4-alpha-glucosidase [Proteobacteria bacterium]|nr:glucan 1,4-alpha-glucosidase [Pseudomonadota bacterium]
MMKAAHDPDFDAWLAHQLACSTAGLLACISQVGIVKQRPGFGQTMRALPGSIVASPVLAAYDPDPDYFFHWFRDAAVVIDALRLLHVDGQLGREALALLHDHARFSLALTRLDGRDAVAQPGRRAAVASDFLQFLRDDAELAQVHGDAVAAEARVNPDGTLDISRWSRPQHDGPPLRALALLRWLDVPGLPADLAADVAALIRHDLGFTLRHGHEPSCDIWEEESGHHYYTLRVSAAALIAGAAWRQAAGDATEAAALRSAGDALQDRLDGYWMADGGTAGYYRSRVLPDGRDSPKALDIAVILAAIHAGTPAGAHGPADPRMHATLARLEALFDAAYPINQGRTAARGPAMGRYAGDVYYSGGAYYFSTLGAAEYCFKAASCATAGEASAWFARGDAYLTTVRAHTPASGELAEQFDQRTGVQTSAKQLGWSHAAFISCTAARRAAAA